MMESSITRRKGWSRRFAGVRYLCCYTNETRSTRTSQDSARDTGPGEGFIFASKAQRNGVKILPRRGRYVESCTGRQNFNVLSLRLFRTCFFFRIPLSHWKNVTEYLVVRIFRKSRKVIRSTNYFVIRDTRYPFVAKQILVVARTKERGT
jgi:hypothetical protein